MNRKRSCVFMQILAAIWLVAYCQFWLPHFVLPFEMPLGNLVFFGTPAAFGVFAYAGWLWRSRALAIGWPLALLAALFLAPAFGVLHFTEWTWPMFSRALPVRSPGFGLHLLLCVLGYLAGFLLARRQGGLAEDARSSPPPG